MAGKSFSLNVICSDPERPIPFADSTDLKLLSSHLTPVLPGLEIREHEHAHWELSFMVRGEMKTFCDGCVIPCSETNGSILLVPPGTLHRRKFGPSEKNCNLTIEFLLTNADAISLAEERCRENHYCFQPESFLHSLLEEIRRLARKDPEHPDWLLPQLSQLFLPTFLRDVLQWRAAGEKKAPPAWKFRSDPERAADILRFLNTRISDSQLLAALPAFFSLSLRQLNRIFEAKYHRTIAAAADEIRFKRALLLLQKTELKIGEITKETGFTTPAGFTLFIRRHTGKTPQALRRL